MKIPGATCRWLAVLLTALAASSYAQKEQWLEYHTTRDGRGYRWLELTTNPPPKIVWPKFNAQPYFALWTTPLDPAGRWLAFDRSRKSGPYDRLYIDTKGDGKVENSTPVSTTRLDQYSAYFEPARVIFKGEDGPITYHLVLRFMSYSPNEVRVLAESGGYYSGLVDFGDGKKRRLNLLDANVNGSFNDGATDSETGDRVLVENDKAGERYQGRLLEVDGQFFRFEAARDGAFVKLKKAEDIAFGQVRVPETLDQLIVYGDNGEFTRKPVKGQLSLPAGKYRISNWTINRKDAKGSSWRMMGYGSDDSGKFEVVSGNPLALPVGEPVYAAMDKSWISKSRSVQFSLRFEGRYHESISFMKGDQRPPGPKLTLASLDGSFRATNTFEFG